MQLRVEPVGIVAQQRIVGRGEFQKRVPLVACYHQSFGKVKRGSVGTKSRTAGSSAGASSSANPW